MRGFLIIQLKRTEIDLIGRKFINDGNRGEKRSSFPY